MIGLRDLKLFRHVAETGSITAAAHHLHLQPATASAALKRLESELGVLLFIRSTRSLRLTEQGAHYLEACRTALDALEMGHARLATETGQMKGTVRISAPSDFGRHTLSRWLVDFQEDHPGVNLTLLLSDRVADLFSEPVDLAIRLGSLRDSSLFASRLARSRRVLCASPDYLARYGAPKAPEDLRDHEIITLELGHYRNNRWSFERKGKVTEVKVESRLCADDGALVRQWAVDGLGIAYKSWLDVVSDIEAGRLVQLLPDYLGEPFEVHLVYPQRATMPETTRKMIDYLKDKAGSLPPCPSHT